MEECADHAGDGSSSSSGRTGEGPETLSFDVTYPDLCNLKQDPKHKLARDYLRRWGIDVSGTTETDPEAS